MRSDIIDKILSEITPEEMEWYEEEMQKASDHHNWMVENGLEYCTNTSPSLMELKQHGFNPIGITSHYLEETFIFRTKKEAKKAFKKMEKELNLISGWWYGKKDWEKEYNDSIKKGACYEKGHPQIYWL